MAWLTDNQFFLINPLILSKCTSPSRYGTNSKFERCAIGKAAYGRLKPVVDCAIYIRVLFFYFISSLLEIIRINSIVVAPLMFISNITMTD